MYTEPLQWSSSLHLSLYLFSHLCFSISMHAAVDCLTLNDPPNGMVDLTEGTELGAAASYVCNIGFMLEGTAQRVCDENGMWTNSEPTCEGMGRYMSDIV